MVNFWLNGCQNWTHFITHIHVTFEELRFSVHRIQLLCYLYTTDQFLTEQLPSLKLEIHFYLLAINLKVIFNDAFHLLVTLSSHLYRKTNLSL